MNWFDASLSDLHYEQVEYRQGFWKLLKNGEPQYVRHQDTRKIWVSFGICTGCYSIKDICFQKSEEMMLPC